MDSSWSLVMDSICVRCDRLANSTYSADWITCCCRLLLCLWCVFSYSAISCNNFSRCLQIYKSKRTGVGPNHSIAPAVNLRQLCDTSEIMQHDVCTCILFVRGVASSLKLGEQKGGLLWQVRECEPIMGICGQCPQRGSRGRASGGGSGVRSPLKLMAF